MKRITFFGFVIVAMIVWVVLKERASQRSALAFVNRVNLGQLLEKFDQAGNLEKEEEFYWNIAGMQSGWVFHRLDMPVEQILIQEYLKFDVMPVKVKDREGNLVYMLHFNDSHEDLIYRKKGERVYAPGVRRTWRNDRWELLDR